MTGSRFPTGSSPVPGTSQDDRFPVPAFYSGNRSGPVIAPVGKRYGREPVEMLFRVDGVAVPQGSKRIGRAGRIGRPIVIDDNPRLQDWRAAVTAAAWLAARNAGWVAPARHTPIVVELEFSLIRPRTSKRAHPTPRGSGDVDKLARAVLDAIVDANVLADDAAIVELTVRKGYAEPAGVDVTVRRDDA